MKTLFRILPALILLAGGAFAYVWFSRPDDVNFDEARAQVPHSQYSRFAEIDGLRVHYQEKGSGPALVLIHGYTSLTYTWKDVFEEFARTSRVIALDLKGHGFTSKPDGDYRMPAQSDLVVKLLDHLKIEQAVFCGNSMGGAVSLMTAINHPGRVKGLILVDSAGIRLPKKNKSVSPDVLGWPFIGPAVAAIALRSDSMVRDGMKNAYTNPAMITDDRVAAYWRPVRTRGGQLAAILAKRQWDMSPVEQALGSVTQPALIIWGANDQVISLEAGKKLNEALRGSQLLVYENCGHAPQEEMPDRFAKDALAFIARVNVPAPASVNDTQSARAGSNIQSLSASK